MSAARKPEHIEADIAQTRENMSQTLDALQHKLSPGNAINQALGFINGKSGSGGSGGGSGGVSDIASGVSEAVRNNPLPAALIGVGLGWLALNAARGDSADDRYYRDRYGRDHDRDDDDYGRGGYGGGRGALSADYAPRSGAATMPPRQHAATASQDASTQSKVRDTMSGVKDSAVSTKDNIKDSVAGAADTVRDKASDAVGAVKDGVNAAQQQIGDVTRRAGETASHYQRRARNGWEKMLEEQPLVLVGAGFAIGALVGAGLPNTRRENELVGRTRDDLLDRVAEAGAEHLETAKSALAAGAEAAVDEAKKSGLDADNIKQAVADSADAAKQAAKKGVEEAKQQGLNKEQAKKAAKDTAEAAADEAKKKADSARDASSSNQNKSK